VAHLFILLSCKIDIVCVWISNMVSIEICFQGFTNDVVGLNESIFYCQKVFWQKNPRIWNNFVSRFAIQLEVDDLHKAEFFKFFQYEQ
jgi:hypothetical protein